jgi:hypothetical protein
LGRVCFDKGKVCDAAGAEFEEMHDAAEKAEPNVGHNNRKLGFQTSVPIGAAK